MCSSAKLDDHNTSLAARHTQPVFRAAFGKLPPGTV